MNKHTRSAPVTATRTTADGHPIYEARAVAYNVIDTFGTRFLPGCFRADLSRREAEGRMPTIRWAHDRQEPIGKVVDVREANDGLYVGFRLDDDARVPRAQQAIAQLDSGTLEEVSVGFGGTFEHSADDKIPELREGELNELSIVAEGAVPGAKVLSMRSDTVVSAAVAGDLIAQFAAGHNDLRTTLNLLADSAVERPSEEPAEGEPTEGEPVEPEGDVEPTEEELATQEAEAQEQAALEAEMDDALAAAAGK